MNQNLVSHVLADLSAGRLDVALLWQAGVLAVCLALSWSFANVLRDRLLARSAGSGLLYAGLESFARIMWPLLALVLIALATPLLAHWQEVSLLRLALPLVGSFALIRMAFHVLRRIFARSPKAGALLLLFETAIASLIWGGVALYITGLWPELRSWLDQTAVPLGRNGASLLVILQVAAWVCVTLLAALWGGTLLEERLMRMEAMHASLRAVMARLVRGLLIVVAVLVSLSLVGIDLTVLSVFGGALGVGLGLGLQRLASSYVSGFVILLERSLTIGDVVTVDQFSGRVTRINTRYTVIRGPDGTETVVPNDMLVSAPVQNASLSDRDMRLSSTIVLGYRTDIEFALHLLAQTAAGVERVLVDPEPRALLVRFDPDGFAVELGFWVGDPENGRGNVLSEVNCAVWRALQRHGIEVPYPQREVRMHGPVEQASLPSSAPMVQSA